MFRESVHIGAVVALVYAFALEMYCEARAIGAPSKDVTAPAGASDGADVPLTAMAKSDEDIEEARGTPATAPRRRDGAVKEVSFASLLESDGIKCVTLRPEALRACRGAIQAWAELAVIMFLFWFCDRSGMVRETKKSYDRDLLATIFCALAAYGWKTSLKESKTSAPLHRQQTEEMKGWMQVLFLLYHYFDAGEMYNLIRVFIAAYVWMTGFGNFSYYYIKKDFSAIRFSQMMWRLNFFVCVTCVVLKNDYMLYYICPMHTLYTLLCYGALAIFKEKNNDPKWIYAKFAMSFVVIAAVWEVPGVFDVLFRPFQFLFGYVNPAKPDIPALHEWHFRSGLDRYVWIYGMICAYAHPRYEAVMKWIDERSLRERMMYQGGIVAASSAVLYWWFITLYSLDKFAYNKYHPYTSWIPLTCFIFLRNATKSLRSYHIEIFCICGQVTLETYICQFHIWLSTSNVPNGQPKLLMDLIPGYPLLNFLMCSYIYVGISHRVFEVTNVLKSSCIPSKDDGALAHNLILGGVFVAVACSIGAFSSLLFTGAT
jgi:N-acetylneuraminate 9-O-acetyltransferase